MRIAIDIRPLTAPHKTGVSIVTDALIRHMATLAPEDEFLLFATGTEETLMNIPEYSQTNVHVITLPIANKVANLIWLLPGSPTMDKFFPSAPDIWLLPNAHIHKTSAPYVVLFHDAAIRTVPECFTMKDHARAWLTNEERTFKNAKAVISVSAHSTQDAITYYGVQEKNIVTAPLGIDHTIFLPREQSSDRSYRAAYDLNRQYILWLATREPRKNVDSVIRAYSEFREHHKESTPLVLVGADGWKIKHIRAALETSPFKKDIRELFYIPEKHKAALYRGATAFLFPSLYEGFGLPVLEAMACGTPVITSLTSSIPDVTGSAALLIDPLNVSDIIQTLNALFDPIDGENLRAILRDRGIAQSELFHWDTTARTVLDVLHDNKRM